MRFPGPTETVTIVRTTPGGLDPYGDPIPGTTTEVPVGGCLVAAAGSTEAVTQGRTPLEADYDIYLPDGTDVRRADQMRIRGALCDVVGAPFGWTGMGMVASAKFAEG